MQIKKILLAVVVVSQLFVPVFMISGYERTLEKGNLYKFQTRPVDPYDAFRGRYVALSMSQTDVQYSGRDKIDYNQPIYLAIGVKPDGFARFMDVSTTPPKRGDYLKTTATSRAYNGKVHFRQPFDRYYMNEKHAPEAEKLYQRHARWGEGSKAYIAVRVHNGKGVIEDLYLDGKPIADFFRKH